MKKLNWYDVTETNKIIINEVEDLDEVLTCIAWDIPLFYNEFNQVFTESGMRIATILEIKED